MLGCRVEHDFIRNRNRESVFFFFFKQRSKLIKIEIVLTVFF